MVSQLDILETMTPTEFLSLREFLASSSGFQSAQFWELEFVLGHKRPQVLSRFLEDSPE
jgi:tryptophan 2,3-dioxygenase